MSDTDHGIPDDVIARAAEAMLDCFCTGEDEIDGHDCLYALNQGVLPVLRPAIREELVREMIADAVRQELYVGHYNGHTDIHDDPLAEWLRTYLPATESETTDVH